jgi:hypothetical protein
MYLWTAIMMLEKETPVMIGTFSRSTKQYADTAAAV